LHVSIGSPDVDGPAAAWGSAQAVALGQLAPLGGHFFVRVFVDLGRAPPPGLVELMGATDPASGRGVALAVEDGALALVGADGRIAAGSTALSVGEWSCLEWEVGGAGMNAWVGTGSAAMLDAAGTGSVPALGELSLGLARPGMKPHSEPIEAWFDELIIDAARVGCDR
jgi:hypothetical protein